MRIVNIYIVTEHAVENEKAKRCCHALIAGVIMTGNTNTVFAFSCIANHTQKDIKWGNSNFSMQCCTLLDNCILCVLRNW